MTASHCVGSSSGFGPGPQSFLPRETSPGATADDVATSLALAANEVHGRGREIDSHLHEIHAEFAEFNASHVADQLQPRDLHHLEQLADRYVEMELLALANSEARRRHEAACREAGIDPGLPLRDGGVSPPPQREVRRPFEGCNLADLRKVRENLCRERGVLASGRPFMVTAMKCQIDLGLDGNDELVQRQRDSIAVQTKALFVNLRNTRHVDSLIDSLGRDPAASQAPATRTFWWERPAPCDPRDFA